MIAAGLAEHRRWVALLSIRVQERVGMCHCFDSTDELSEQERADLVEEHSLDELRAEHSDEELERLGVSG